MKNFQFGFWSKLFAGLLILVVSIFLWLFWSNIFPPDYEEIIPIRLEGNGVSREFRIKRGLIDIAGNGSGLPCCERVRSHIKLVFTYPDVGRPKSWIHNKNEVHKHVMIFIYPVNPRGTSTEQMVKYSENKGHISSIAPGFPMLKGKQDGFDIYDELPVLKTKTQRRSLVFKDAQGELVGIGVGSGSQALMFGNLEVHYFAKSHNNQPPESNYFLKSYGLQTTDEISNPNKPSHREMRDWVESVVKSILEDTKTYPRAERVNEAYGSNKPVSEK
jgi:hypothetical protein